MALHGFTQTHASLAPLLGAFSGRRTLLVADLPGHGGSAAIEADLEATATLVCELASEEPFDLLGYSLGGRVALHVTCRRPPGLRRVAVIGAHPGLLDPAARAQRLEADLALADALERDGDVGGFVARWLAAPMFATLPRSRAQVEDRRENTAAGLAASLRRCSLGTQRPLHDELVEVETPVCYLAGARDDPFVARAVGLAARNRRAAAAIVPGAGHACHLERPELTARILERWLDG